MKASATVELSRLKIGRRASSGCGDGEPAVGLAGGVHGKAKVFPLLAVTPKVGLACWGCDGGGTVVSAAKKLIIELVGDNDSEPVGEARSEPVLILSGGLSGSCCCCIEALAAAAAAAAF